MVQEALVARAHRRDAQLVDAAVHSNAVSLAIERSDHRAEAVVQVGPANEAVNTDALVLGEHRACFVRPWRGHAVTVNELENQFRIYTSG